MSAWATTIISGLVLIVAFMQWRTAHQKVLLDLFEKRLKVYEMAKEAVGEMSPQKRPANRANQILMAAFDASKFLFGADVQDYVDRLWTLNAQLQEIDRRFGNREATREDADLHLKIASEVSDFHFKASRIFAPYMRMDQKRVRTPVEWLEDRNRIRLSYADDKQK